MRLRHIALGLAFTTLLAPRARAAVSFAANLPEQVVPGQEIELRWSDLPPAVEEVEILLSLDGGRSFPIRVSPELDARSGRKVWRVPPIRGEHAMLQLRMGTGEAELPGPASPAFRIAVPRRLEGATCSAAIGDIGVAAYAELPSWSDLESCAAGASSLRPPEQHLGVPDPTYANARPDPVALDLPRETGCAAVLASDPCGRPCGRAPNSTPRDLPLRI